MKIKDKLIFLIPIIGMCSVVFLVASITITITIDTAKEIIEECYEKADVKYRYEGTGGLFGGVRKIYLHSDSQTFDGKENICISGNNVFGEFIDNKKKYFTY